MPIPFSPLLPYSQTANRWISRISDALLKRPSASADGNSPLRYFRKNRTTLPFEALNRSHLKIVSVSSRNPNLMESSAQLNFVFSVILAAFLLCSADASHDVHYCDKKVDYPVKVQSVEISPDPVVSGKLATFSISASSGQTITGGKVVIDVAYFGIHVHTEKHELCKETSCPVGEGDFVLAHAESLPGFTPPGSYKLKMTMLDEHGHTLSCINIDFRIVFSSGVADS